MLIRNEAPELRLAVPTDDLVSVVIEPRHSVVAGRHPRRHVHLVAHEPCPSGAPVLAVALPVLPRDRRPHSEEKLLARRCRVRAIKRNEPGLASLQRLPDLRRSAAWLASQSIKEGDHNASSPLVGFERHEHRVALGFSDDPPPLVPGLDLDFAATVRQCLSESPLTPRHRSGDPLIHHGLGECDAGALGPLLDGSQLLSDRGAVLLLLRLAQVGNQRKVLRLGGDLTIMTEFESC